MIISVCSMRESEFHTVRNAAERSRNRRVDQMVDQIMALPERTKIQLLAPVVRGRKGDHVKASGESAERADMYVCVIDGNLYELSEEIAVG